MRSEAATADSASGPITVVGAGPAGSLLSILLAKRGQRVVLLERLPDVRESQQAAGRSINLALAERGIHALRIAGALEKVRPQLIPMRGRILHELDREPTLFPYGAHSEAIYSVSRAALNAALLDCADSYASVEIRFRQTCLSVDAAGTQLGLQDLTSGNVYSLPLDRVVGADGAGSVLRRFLTERVGFRCTEDLLPHGYKEITLPAGPGGTFQLDANALHVWPRGHLMLIALPNPGGSFTATLFLPFDGTESFGSLGSSQAVEAFFARHFPDVYRLIPDLAAQFFSRPIGNMGTVRCERWSLEDRLLLLGDAAHAIVPFHGQGMNCALEDCVELVAQLDRLGNWRAACEAFDAGRRTHTDAIADMALENYVEMRDTVRDPQFQLQKELSLELERRFPERFVPRYSMVMFHPEIPYATAKTRGAVQAEILSELTKGATRLAEVDFERAAELIAERLTPLEKRVAGGG